MTEDNIPHFEQVWTESELLTQTKYKDTQAVVIIDKLKTLLSGYDALNTFAESSAARQNAKTKYMGEIIFLISALSHRDDINVWAALAVEMTNHKTT
jgi:hypothetical protein